MFVYINNKLETYFEPRYKNEEIVIGIDSSKSNTGISIESLTTGKEEWFEFNGKEDGTTEEDTLRLCKQERNVMKQLLRGANIRAVGIENIITKEERGRKTGISVHQARFKITAVFMSFISFFQDEFNITPVLINNQAWKSAMLPPEFCKRDIGKGSLAYFKAIGSKYQYCSDDVTDAVCIKNYLKKLKGIESSIYVTQAELEKHESLALLCDVTREFKMPTQMFKYNPELDFAMNKAFISNRIKSGQLGVCRIKINDLDFDTLYKYCKGSFKKVTPEVLLAVKLKE